MEDTLKLVLDSALHTANHILHAAPGEGANFAQWLGWGVAIVTSIIAWWQYKLKLKRNK